MDHLMMNHTIFIKKTNLILISWKVIMDLSSALDSLRSVSTTWTSRTKITQLIICILAVVLMQIVFYCSWHHSVSSSILAMNSITRVNLSYSFSFFLSLIFVIGSVSIFLSCFLVKWMRKWVTIRLSPHQAHLALCPMNWIGEEEENWLSWDKNCCLFFLIHSNIFYIYKSMNRQLFREVFRQISSKIDQLKTFLIHETYSKVKHIIYVFDKDRIINSFLVKY
jgi:hypothetical protein